MTAKKCISFLIVLLLLTGCRTSRNARQAALTRPDALVQAVVTDPNRPTQDEGDEAVPSARININKVERMMTDTWQGKVQTVLDSMINLPLFETTQLGLCVFDLTDDRMLYAVNADQRMRPASNQKLVTAIAALDILGTDYRFRPTVMKPGWGWCWDDEETGIKDFKGKGARYNADTLYREPTERTLADVLVPMMKKSDNMLAESVFWQLTMSRDLKTVTRKDCTARINEVVGKAGNAFTNFVIADGSGVSLYNYLSPRLLLMLLRYAYQTPSVYNALYASLPIAGVDGTLSKRMAGTAAENNVHAKTGTVTGVSSLSGYCTHPSGHVLAFSIMNQGISRSALGRDFQDKVCAILCQ